MVRPVLAGMLSVLLVAAVIALGLGVLGGEDAAPDAAPVTPSSPEPVRALPPRQSPDLRAAAAAAGCRLQSPPNEGADHEERQFSAADYGSNPPTSGTHFPEWADDGIYAPGTTPELGMLVHTLEHGRVDLQYRPGTSEATVARLELLVNELGHGYHIVLFENQTGMDYAVAATAWDHLLGCPEFNDRVFDALRAFHAAFVDKGPEVVP